MKRRTTVDIDDALLEQALGGSATRATIEEALQRVAESIEDERSERAARHRGYLERLPSRTDIEVLVSDEM